MTTSLSNPEGSLPTVSELSVDSRAVKYTTYRIKHTLASRFAFLIVCLAIILSAVAYGTVHYWALALFFLGAVAVVILWVVDSWNLGSVRLNRNPLQFSLLGMMLLGIVQLLPLRTPGASGLSVPFVKSLSLDPYSTRLELVQTCALTIYFAAALIFTDTPKRLRVLVRTIIIFGFLLAIFGLTQSFTSPNKIYWLREMAQATPFGPFINRHHFAGYMELALALPLGLLASGSVAKEKRIIYAFVAGLMAVALLMTNSRGGLISLGAEILFIAVIGFGVKRRNNKNSSIAHGIKSVAVRATLALGLVVALMVGLAALGGEDALNRLVGTVNSEDPSTGRLNFWDVTVDIIKNHPIIGTGLGAFGVVYTGYDSRNGLYRLEQAHNDYLQVLSDGGIVGALIGLFFIINLFRLGFMRRESRDEFRRGVATGAMAGCFAVLVHSFFDFTLHTPANALLFLVLAALATMNGRVEDVQNRRKTHRRRDRRSSPAQDAAAV